MPLDPLESVGSLAGSVGSVETMDTIPMVILLAFPWVYHEFLWREMASWLGMAIITFGKWLAGWEWRMLASSDTHVEDSVQVFRTKRFPGVNYARNHRPGLVELRVVSKIWTGPFHHP